MTRAHKLRRRAFILFEVMIAVLIFSVGVLALGKCVESCLQAEIIKQDDARARRALEDRVVEIEAGVIPRTDSSTEELKAPYAGMTLKTKRTKEKFKNEKDLQFEIEKIALEITWKVDGKDATRTLEFYARPQQP